jgi:hypothetical protein
MGYLLKFLPAFVAATPRRPHPSKSWFSPSRCGTCPWQAVQSWTQHSLDLQVAISPYCEQFVKEELAPAFQDLGTSIMNVTVIPFGNARLNETAKTIQCQHGLAECDANTFELCAIEMFPHVEDYLPFLVCMAEKLPSGYHKDVLPQGMFQECAEKTGVWWDALLACHDTKRVAWKVNLDASLSTPTHPYVPYVLLNGTPLPDGADFHTEICRIYTRQGGTSKKCGELLSSESASTKRNAAAVCTNELTSLQ